MLMYGFSSTGVTIYCYFGLKFNDNTCCEVICKQRYNDNDIMTTNKLPMLKYMITIYCGPSLISFIRTLSQKSFSLIRLKFRCTEKVQYYTTKLSPYWGLKFNDNTCCEVIYKQRYNNNDIMTTNKLPGMYFFSLLTVIFPIQNQYKSYLIKNCMHFFV
jgi:hypothetical protein